MVEHVDVETVLGRVHVAVAGEGPAVVMWPSLLMDHTLWDAQVAHLSNRFTTIAVDPPGHGRSQPLTRTFTFAECAQVVVDLLDHLGHERGHLLGNSWGGMIGGTFAALHPDRVGCSVLMNATATAASRGQRLEYGALLLAARAMRGIRPPLTTAVLRAFLGPTSLAERPDVVEHVRRTTQAVDVRSVSFAVRSVVPARQDQRAAFSQITTPVLVVGGSEDATFPPDDARTMAAAIPDSELVVLARAAHLAALEVPDVVNRLVDDLLDRRGGAPNHL